MYKGVTQAYKQPQGIASRTAALSTPQGSDPSSPSCAPCNARGVVRALNSTSQIRSISTNAASYTVQGSMALSDVGQSLRGNSSWLARAIMSCISLDALLTMLVAHKSELNIYHVSFGLRAVSSIIELHPKDELLPDATCLQIMAILQEVTESQIDSASIDDIRHMLDAVVALPHQVAAPKLTERLMKEINVLTQHVDPSVSHHDVGHHLSHMAFTLSHLGLQQSKHLYDGLAAVSMKLYEMHSGDVSMAALAHTAAFVVAAYKAGGYVSLPLLMVLSPGLLSSLDSLPANVRSAIQPVCAACLEQLPGADSGLSGGPTAALRQLARLLAAPAGLPLPEAPVKTRRIRAMRSLASLQRYLQDRARGIAVPHIAAVLEHLPALLPASPTSTPLYTITTIHKLLHTVADKATPDIPTRYFARAVVAYAQLPEAARAPFLLQRLLEQLAATADATASRSRAATLARPTAGEANKQEYVPRTLLVQLAQALRQLGVDDQALHGSLLGLCRRDVADRGLAASCAVAWAAAQHGVVDMTLVAELGERVQSSSDPLTQEVTEQLAYVLKVASRSSGPAIEVAPSFLADALALETAPGRLTTQLKHSSSVQDLLNVLSANSSDMLAGHLWTAVFTMLRLLRAVPGQADAKQQVAEIGRMLASHPAVEQLSLQQCVSSLDGLSYVPCEELSAAVLARLSECLCTVAGDLSVRELSMCLDVLTRVDERKLDELLGVLAPALLRHMSQLSSSDVGALASVMRGCGYKNDAVEELMLAYVVDHWAALRAVDLADVCHAIGFRNLHDSDQLFVVAADHIADNALEYTGSTLQRMISFLALRPDLAAAPLSLLAPSVVMASTTLPTDKQCSVVRSYLTAQHALRGTAQLPLPDVLNALLPSLDQTHLQAGFDLPTLALLLPACKDAGLLSSTLLVTVMQVSVDLARSCQGMAPVETAAALVDILHATSEVHHVRDDDSFDVLQYELAKMTAEVLQQAAGQTAAVELACGLGGARVSRMYALFSHMQSLNLSLFQGPVRIAKTLVPHLSAADIVAAASSLRDVVNNMATPALLRKPMHSLATKIAVAATPLVGELELPDLLGLLRAMYGVQCRHRPLLLKVAALMKAGARTASVPQLVAMATAYEMWGMSDTRMVREMLDALNRQVDLSTPADVCAVLSVHSALRYYKLSSLDGLAARVQAQLAEGAMSVAQVTQVLRALHKLNYQHDGVCADAAVLVKDHVGSLDVDSALRLLCAYVSLSPASHAPLISALYAHVNRLPLAFFTAQQLRMLCVTHHAYRAHCTATGSTCPELDSELLYQAGQAWARKNSAATRRKVVSAIMEVLPSVGMVARADNQAVNLQLRPDFVVTVDGVDVAVVVAGDSQSASNARSHELGSWKEWVCALRGCGWPLLVAVHAREWSKAAKAGNGRAAQLLADRINAAAVVSR